MMESSDGFKMRIGVLRLGHRVKRDDRVTTHVLLAARAFGCDLGILSGDRDDSILKSLKDVTERWGGFFEMSYKRNWRKVLRDWKGKSVLLTMYGMPVQDKIKEIRGSREDLLIVVGSEKIPGDVYGLVEWNIAVTSQPHSEVAALAVFLNMLLEGLELKREFKGAKIRVIPQERGKKIISLAKEHNAH